MLSDKFVTESLLEDFKSDDSVLRLRRYKIACILSFVGTFSGIPLDYLIYPELLLNLFIIRAFAIASIGVLFVSSYSNIGKKYIVLLGITLALTINCSIAAMIYLSEGILSPYYAGLNLVILGTGVLLPWTFIETLFVSGITLLLYIIACFLHGSVTDFIANWNILFNNSFFILLTGVISTTSSYFNTQARINDFNLRTELDYRNQELEKWDQLKTQFFANVSHELRTPLTLILLPIQEILQSSDQLTEKFVKLLHTAENNTLRLLKLVNDLLEVTKLEEGQAKLIIEPIEVNAFLGASVDSIQLKAEEKGLTIQKQLAEKLLVVEADSYALERICLNLLTNAIKFTSKGGAITAICREVKGQVVIEVQDTGIGINKQELPYIFDRFHQVDSSDTRHHQGTGLGLTLVKELSEQMHGMVSAESQFGEGSTIGVVLPLSQKEYTVKDIWNMPTQGDLLETIYRDAEYAVPIDAPAAKPETINIFDEKPLILIVDDESDMRNYLVSMFEQDYQILQAANGREGLELARAQLPILILLDMMMPEMSGLEVCKQLKASEETKTIKIILLTAGLDETKKLEVLALGVDDYLTKPFNRLEVKTRLRNLIQTALLDKKLREHTFTLEQTLKKLQETQAQLIQSEKLNALGSLTAGLLHEINNPLNYTLTALQIMKIDPYVKENNDLEEIVSDIDEGMQRIQSIVTDLHTFAHPDNIENKQTFSFINALEIAERFTAHEYSDISIKHELVNDDDVMGSKNHVVQVLVNLLSNSSKAIQTVNGQRQGEISISSNHRNECLHIVFRDNGKGMKNEELDHIFEPFFTTRDVGEGMGLGLSICHSIIKNHGGDLSVKSQIGQWTEFTFDLPMVSHIEEQETV
ncbi:MAG: ATP-binding protein [Proteobacteria bacterium]|nr:ATP-binding protein [Pseudomonadota bacterium]